MFRSPIRRRPVAALTACLAALVVTGCGADPAGNAGEPVKPGGAVPTAAVASSACAIRPGAPLAASQRFGLLETEVFAVDAYGKISSASVLGGGSWLGMSPVNATSVAAAGARLAASNQFGLPFQTDLFFVDRNGAVEVSWALGGGAFHTPVAISPAGTAPPGGAIVASNQFGIPSQTDVFFVDSAGAVNIMWVVGGGTWNGPARITPTGTAPPGGAVAVSNQFGLDQTDVFFVDNAGAVNVLWVVGSGDWNGPARITPTGTTPPGAPLAASQQFGAWYQTDAFFVDNAGALDVLWVNGAGPWSGPARITPTGTAPAGAAVAASSQFGLPSQTDVFFVDRAGAVNVSWVVGSGAWKGPGRITATGAAPPGGAVTASAQFGVTGQTDVFFVDRSCALNVLWVNYGGSWSGGRAGLPYTAARTYPVDRLYAADGTLLAVYDHSSATFTTFKSGGVNLIGGFSSGAAGTNLGPSARGHSSDYPFGRLDDPTDTGKSHWEGFWAGFNFVNDETGFWEGVNGNPRAEKLFEIKTLASGSYDVHVVSEVEGPQGPDFRTDVHYYVSRKGIGVSSVVTFLRDLFSPGGEDSGGQLLMTQADIDLDPTQPDPVYPYSHEKAKQPSLYWKLALDGLVQDIDSFPPYNEYTPSNMWGDGDIPAEKLFPLPDTARIPAGLGSSYLTPFDRPNRALNLALRIDLKRSTLPPLEYYCEVNGERDYFNYLYSPAVGDNRGTYIPAGTVWHLYGDLLPWRGSDPTVLRTVPSLSAVAP